MDTFLKNFRSLQLDFIRDFKELKYKGFSLPHLSNFRSIILRNEPLMNELNHPNFIRKVKNQVNDETEFQKEFNTFVNAHEKRQLVKKKPGKVVVHLDKLLRLSPKTINSFDGSQTIFLETRKQPKRLKQSNSKINKGNQTKSNKKVKRPLANKNKTKKKAVSLDTMKVSAVKKKDVHRKRPVLKKKRTSYNLNNYVVDTRVAVTKVQNQARLIFKRLKKHHLYKDKEFQNWLLNTIKTVINYIEMTINFLNDVSPSCIIVSTTHSIVNRVLTVVASEKGIPTICMQHGIISSEIGYIPKIATIDAVYGHFERNWYIKRGAPIHSVEIIGHPRFDQISTRSKITRKTFEKKLGLSSNRKTIMIAVRNNDDIDKWQTFIQRVSRKINLNILIKNYPSKTPHVLTKKFPFVHSTQDYHIYDIFPNVDAVIAYSSTVGLEAMIAGKPVFILNKSFPGHTGYYNRLGDLVQTDPRVLATQMIKYFKNRQFRVYTENKRKKFLNYAYPGLSNSEKRLKNLINRLTG
ncbi:hypothetical protein [Oceanobacillus senegalensis]|uniref:hypothetical protein n=1 Tax=Oceanobacillus senegalensis TaxID=1936063 RepID=UPI000A305253|nr:hypothetical protein [Oceanobacillus senegalensis]